MAILSVRTPADHAHPEKAHNHHRHRRPADSTPPGTSYSTASQPPAPCTRNTTTSPWHEPPHDTAPLEWSGAVPVAEEARVDVGGTPLSASAGARGAGFEGAGGGE